MMHFGCLKLRFDFELFAPNSLVHWTNSNSHIEFILLKFFYESVSLQVFPNNATLAFDNTSFYHTRQNDHQ